MYVLIAKNNLLPLLTQIGFVQGLSQEPDVLTKGVPARAKEGVCGVSAGEEYGELDVVDLSAKGDRDSPYCKDAILVILRCKDFRAVGYAFGRKANSISSKIPVPKRGEFMNRQSPNSLQEETKPRLYILLAMALLLVASSDSAWAQVAASISGRIEDPSGATIPAATVTVTNLETGAARTVTTDEAGLYRVLSLPVGQYAVKAEKEGFRALLQTGINLVVGQEAVVNLKLDVGEVQQQVTVTAEGQLVNTTTASVSGLVGEKQVRICRSTVAVSIT